jgi:hypothetical protein
MSTHKDRNGGACRYLGSNHPMVVEERLTIVKC